MERAGFQCLAGVDFNPQAVAVFRHNFQHVPHVLEKDMTKFGPEELSDLLGKQEVDVIVGGPPCQGFSTARQRDGANNGERLKDDPRRRLFREFLRHIEYFQPKVFIMENVLGIRTAEGGAYYTAVQHEARNLGKERGLPGYRVHSQIEDAYELGVPQKRRRQLFIGVRNDVAGYFSPELKPPMRAIAHTNLGAALGDLPRLKAGSGEESCAYELSLREQHLTKSGVVAQNYLTKVLEVHRAKQLTAHRARPHSDRDLGDFAKLKEGESSAKAMRRGVVFDFPYSTESFSDRYTRQSRSTPCSTIVAHLSKDGLMFIHPTQNRTLTPREAARIQSFPDWFELPVARTHQFRIIGNAVPPLIAEAVGDAVKKFLDQAATEAKTLNKQITARSVIHPTAAASIPHDLFEACALLSEVAKSKHRELQAIDAPTFMRLWHAMLFAFPDLHPDNAHDHGDAMFEIEPPLSDAYELRRRYSRSGWPVALEFMGKEAWRRYEAGRISEADFYCVEAQKRGVKELDFPFRKRTENHA
ncbi:MAG: hypothetical protein RL693_782 [Verrucomicrobiota bacterium]